MKEREEQFYIKMIFKLDKYPPQIKILCAVGSAAFVLKIFGVQKKKVRALRIFNFAAATVTLNESGDINSFCDKKNER